MTQTLAELERKLRELERELAAVGREDHGARLVDEGSSAPQAEAAVPTPAAPPLPTPAAPPLSPPVTPFPADEPRSSSAAGVSIDLEQLLHFRDKLERVTQGLVDDYTSLLPGRPVRQQDVVEQPPEPLPQAPLPAPQPPPRLASPDDDVLFEGHVELGVGPFYDIGSLSAFEQSLARLPHATEASVRRFEASHAVLDVRLSAPTRLIGELRGVLGAHFSVRDLSPGRVSLTFDEA